MRENLKNWKKNYFFCFCLYFVSTTVKMGKREIMVCQAKKQTQCCKVIFEDALPVAFLMPNLPQDS
jgi:hypothetical protein